MKAKMVCKSLVLVLVFLMAAAILPAEPALAQTVCLQVDGEGLADGAPIPGWNLVFGGPPAIATVTATSNPIGIHSGDRGVRVNGDYASGKEFDVVAKGIVTVDYWHYPKPGTSTNSMMDLNGGNYPDYWPYLTLWKNDQDLWWISDGGGVHPPVASYTGQYTHIVITIDTNTGLFDVNIDEQLVYQSTVANADKIGLSGIRYVAVHSGRGGGGTDSYFDDILITANGSVPTDTDSDGILDDEDLDDDNDEFSDNTETEVDTDPKDATSKPSLEIVQGRAIDIISDWAIDDEAKKDELIKKLTDIYSKYDKAKTTYNQFNSLENMINDMVSDGELSYTDAMPFLSLAVELLPSKSAQYEPIVEEEGYVYHWFTFNEEQIQEIAYSTSDAYLYANWMTDYIFTFSGGWGLGIARFIGHTSLTKHIIDKAETMIQNNPEAFDDDTITVEMNVSIRSRTDKIGEWTLRIGDFIASKWRQLAKGF